MALQRSIPVTALMSKSHPLANSSRVSLKDLTGYPFIADAHIDPDDTLDVLGLQSHTDPVSYTHLDVYKRQVMTLPFRPFARAVRM